MSKYWENGVRREERSLGVDEEEEEKKAGEDACLDSPGKRGGGRL